MRKERWIHAGLAALLTAATLCGCSSSSAGSSQASKTESTTESAAKSTASAENSKTEAVGFVQVTDTANGWNFIDPETDQFEVQTTLEDDGIASRIYKPSSGKTLIVTFHGNGEGGTEEGSNNYSQIAANRQAATMASKEVQEGFGGAYVLSFQTPDDWYHDHTKDVKKVIDEVIEEYDIDPERVYATGLSAGGLMTERMVATYPELFNGALISCAAIAKNDTYIEGSETLPDLGGDYDQEDYDVYPDKNDSEVKGVADDKSLDAGDEKTGFKTEDGTAYAKFKKPADYDQYVKNYETWIEALGKSDVPLYLVHCYEDPTIYYTWTEKAAKEIEDYRKANNLSGEVRTEIIDSTDPWPGHWAWVKMYNNDITDGETSTIDWFTSLAEPTEGFEYVAVEEQKPETKAEEGKLTYSLKAEVLDDGEKVTEIVINPGSLDVDTDSLKPEAFKITRENYDTPEEVSVKEVKSDEDGNIVLVLDTQLGVLQYNGTRNVIEPIVYTIEDMEIPVR